jgi:hypothetical protein
MAISNATLGQVVRGKLHRHAITGEDSDSIATEFAGQVGKNSAVGIKLNAEQTTRELFNYSTRYFNTIFFTQSSSLIFG